LRRPNPWISVPAVVIGLLAGLLGWFVTDLSCTTSDPAGAVSHCYGWSAALAVASFLVVTAGMSLVLVLVYRSLGEWQEARARNQEPPGPGCEV
jgi:cytochrome c-type biogenesis protein CcmH/NrfG